MNKVEILGKSQMGVKKPGAERTIDDIRNEDNQVENFSRRKI